MKEIKITTEYITLGQFLKFADIIANGSEAKYYLQNHLVMVNKEEEKRRGRKLYPNDEIRISKTDYKITQ